MARCGCGYDHDGKRVNVCSKHARVAPKKKVILKRKVGGKK